MISYADLEFAIQRWKARTTGAPEPAAPAASGAVAGEIPGSGSQSEIRSDAQSHVDVEDERRIDP
jgi:hypothetical protein